MVAGRSQPLVRLRRGAAVAVGAVVTVLAIAVIGFLQIRARLDTRPEDLTYAAAEERADWNRLETALVLRISSARGYLLTGAPEFLRERDDAGATLQRHLHRLHLRDDHGPTAAELDRVGAAIAQVDEIAGRMIRVRLDAPDRALEIWSRESRPASAAAITAIERAADASLARFEVARARSLAGAARVTQILIALAVAVLALLLLLAAAFARAARDVVLQQDIDREQTMFRLLDQLPVGVYVVRPDGQPYFVNQHARELLGDDADAAVTCEPLARALAGETSELAGAELRRGDETIPIHVDGGSVRDRHGEVAFSVATFQDVRALHRLAHEDALTRLPNRLAVTQVYGRERLRCARSQRPLAVAIIDLDRFKLVNDEHGHAMGDEVLRRSATAVTRALRKTDLVARWGGEELVVLLPETDVAAAERTITRALVSVQDEAFLGAGGQKFRVSFSAGIVTAAAGESIEGAVARADRFLYAAKAAGRARVFSERVVTQRIPTISELAAAPATASPGRAA